MFSFVANHKRLLQILLMLVIVPPFALWGVDSYQNMGNKVGEVASVGSIKIVDNEFTAQVRAHQERMQQLLGRNYNPAIFDTREARNEILENMIVQRLVTQHVIKSRMVVTDDALREMILATPAFQDNGKFSRERYVEVLKSERGERGEGMTPEMFENSLRRDLLVQQLSAAVGEGGLVSKAIAREWAGLAGENREISTLKLAAGVFAAKVKTTPESIKAFYDANRSRFEVPEQVKVEYVLLDADALASADPVSAKEIQETYDQRRAQYEVKEQRQASHILIATKQGANAEEKAKARARAEDLLAKAIKTPASFADLAKKNSDDPGSAEKGGDIGLFSRGLVAKAFEDAAFSMKLNEISGPVETEFGFHVIRLTTVIPGKLKPLAEVRGDIERDLVKLRAGRKFAEAAEQFSNMVYEQSDTLKPVSERFKLAVRDGGWVTRGGTRVPQLSHPRVIASLFSDESIKNHRNTEAIEVSQGSLVSARVVEHKAATLKPLEEVQKEVLQLLLQKESAGLAWKDGAERLEQLRKGESAGLPFSTPKTMGREGAEQIPPPVLEAAFRADRNKLPSYVGVELNDGYVLVRVSKVVAPKLDDNAEKNAQMELGRAMGATEFRAYLKGLRAGATVTINQKAIEPKNTP
ncbi:MAG: peptidylprolyl isomerase [Betaproteobacteria bacterium]|nr:peptidylprolyl isomerase [Betaproteobacteria bacterium]